MEDIFDIINDTAATDYPTAFSANWFLFGSAMFVDLLSCLISLVVLYNTVKSMIATRRFTLSTDPINMYKWIISLASLTVLLRTSIDAALLLSWGEINFQNIMYLNNLDRAFDILSIVPLMAFVYLVLRSGPVIEFQLLRKPIPTNIYPTWRMLRKPIFSFLTIIILCIIVTVSK